MKPFNLSSLVAGWILFAGLTCGNTQVDEVAVGGHIAKPGPYAFVSAQESLAELLNRVGGIPVTRGDFNNYQAGELVAHVRIVHYRGGKKQEYRIDPKSSLLWDLKVQKQDAIVVTRAGLLDGGDFSAILKLSRPASGKARTSGGDKPSN